MQALAGPNLTDQTGQTSQTELTLDLSIRHVATSYPAGVRIEVFDPIATLSNNGQILETNVPLGQCVARSSTTWPPHVHILLQQFAQLPAGIEQSVCAQGGDCVRLGPPVPPPSVPLAPPPPASVALRVGDLATNPIFCTLAQDKPELAQMLLLTLQQQQQRRTHLGHTLVPTAPRHEILIISAAIPVSLASIGLAVPLTLEATCRALGGTVEEPAIITSFAPPRFLALSVSLAIPLPAPASVTAAITTRPVVERAMNRNGFIVGGLPLRVEPLDPVSKAFAAKMGPRKNALEIYLVINNPPFPQVSANDLTQHFTVTSTWAFLDRGFDPVPGTKLQYMFITNELRPSTTALAFMELDGKTAFGCKMRVTQITDPDTFFQQSENTYHLCKSLALADPDLKHLVEEQIDVENPAHAN
ncbi:hypothetical protein GGF32_005198 [Allomyces javanicus]|nr:hypothetical protein GGF32_005198 [Allomyces javanicus]